MELKNIHNRTEFLKLYEFIGGTEGGYGAKDGFANNTKLKDSYLGKLVDGIFKGVGWLWRKSKENFMINKLIAQLINELMRAVILFCFDNKIDLKEGKFKNAEGAQNIVSNTDEENGLNVSNLSGSTNTMTGTTTTTGTTTMSTNTGTTVGTLIERINQVKTVDEFNIIKVEADGEIGKNNTKIRTNTNTSAAHQRTIDTITDKPRIESHRKSIERLNVESEAAKKYVQEIKDALSKKEKELGLQKAQSDFATIAKNCKDKYDFESKITIDAYSGDYDIFGGFAYETYTKQFQRYKTPFIQIDDAFTVLDKHGDTYDIKIYDVNVKNGKVSYMNGKDEIWISSNALLPDGFPSFKDVKEKALPFLTSHISEYPDGLTKTERYRMELIYMNYVQIKDLSEYEKMTNESIEYIREDRSTGASAGGTVKLKTDEPRAGKVGVGRAVVMKAGVQATAGNILTKRDRLKYKEENSEEFKVKVHDINLAEIEKTIRSMNSNSETDLSGNTISSSSDNVDVKTKVTSYVNPYNLKMIQLSAEKLLLPVKGDETNNNEILKIRWKKEVNRVYAAFHYLMDFDKIDITKDINEYMFGGKLLNKSKVENKVNSNSKNLTGQQQLAPILGKLNLEPDLVNWRDVGGNWSVFNFLYPKNKNSYIAAIAPVNAVKNDYKLVNIVACFSNYNDDNTIVVNNDFNTNFLSGTYGNITPKSDPNSKRVYFLMRQNQSAAASTKAPLGTSFFALIEVFTANGACEIFIRKNSTNQRNIPLTDNLLKNFNMAEYVHSMDQKGINEFTVPMDPNVEKAFGFNNDKSSLGFNFFTGSNKPVFLTSKPDRDALLKKLADLLK